MDTVYKNGTDFVNSNIEISSLYHSSLFSTGATFFVFFKYVSPSLPFFYNGYLYISTSEIPFIKLCNIAA